MKFCLLTAMLFSSANLLAQTSPGTLLEIKNSDGGGRAGMDVTVNEDGSVRKNLSGVVEVFMTLSSQEIALIKYDIAATSETELLRLNPAQGFNPGGFEQDCLFYKNGEIAFTFEKNTSGVDFGIVNSSSAAEMTALLKHLNALAYVAK